MTPNAPPLAVRLRPIGGPSGRAVARLPQVDLA